MVLQASFAKTTKEKNKKGDEEERALSEPRKEPTYA
jgi:hypothetical protein